MGKTFRREKTLDRQRKKLNKNRKPPKPPKFRDFNIDPIVDEDLGESNAEEIHPEQTIHKQGPPKSTG